jgi:hypothetical protein
MTFIWDSLLSWYFPRLDEDNQGVLKKSSCCTARVSERDPHTYSSVFIELLAVTKASDESGWNELKYFVGWAAAVLFWEDTANGVCGEGCTLE